MKTLYLAIGVIMIFTGLLSVYLIICTWPTPEKMQMISSNPGDLYLATVLTSLIIIGGILLVDKNSE